MPRNQRRSHRAPRSGGFRVKAGVTALGTVAAVLTVFLVVTGSVLGESDAALSGKSDWHPYNEHTPRVVAKATSPAYPSRDRTRPSSPTA